ncbi:peptidoglycan editing factor PgeF [Alteromonas sp. ASW11-36]|uniref:Purine nucleoside phosphorylase n=1 Tax=Alteromonas arenosi TaxID=3055817 RepID=A0ABT7SUC7_9ALTE|nr:peptidoglycan editing factor PgeF [Alteromonas sp. ASW11-36]MDM7859797.1 peptidoglycan editing factor PgeF [Alteromonas sp. ASW11-36]
MINSDALLRPDWQAPETIEAYSTTRIGGLSKDEFGSLNLGDHVGDLTESVNANRALLPHHESITWLTQIHSNTVISLPSEQSVGDAVYTSEVGVACAVMTADCVPILMADKHGQTVAAIHAGLKGLGSQIIQRTVERAYARQNGAQLLAWIGPHIGPNHYEVSSQDAEIFGHIDGAVTPSGVGKVRLNLEFIARYQLQSVDVRAVFSTGHCTYSRETEYFSYRRSRHQGMENCGRMVSVIIKRA